MPQELEEESLDEIKQETQQETQVNEEDNVKEEAPAVLDSTENDMVKALRERKADLLNSERGGFFNKNKNSSYFNAVISSIDKFAGSLESNAFSGNLETDSTMVDGVKAALKEADDACAAYLGRGVPFTSAGKVRYHMIEQLRSLLASDLIGINSWLDVMVMLPEAERANLTWIDVISSARRLKIEVEDIEKLDKVGGGASMLYHLTDNNNQAGVYFKKEENIFIGDENEQYKDEFLRTVVHSVIDNIPKTPQNMPMLKELSGFVFRLEYSQEDEILMATQSDGVYETFAEYTERVGESQKKRMKNPQLYPQLSAYFYQISKKHATDSTTSMRMRENGMKYGEHVNISRRNVATSRIAELLGIGSIIARSQTAELIDQQGRRIVGNMMAGAQGITLSKMIDAFKSGGLIAPELAENYIKSKLTGSAIAQISNMQLLDTLCAQIDRHNDNRLYIVENGKLTGVRGIDNDLSFGLDTDIARLKTGGDNVSSAFVKKDENDIQLLLPYADKNVVTAILNLSEGTAKLALFDLLTAEEINAFCIRLKAMQEVLRKTMENDGDRFLTGSQWDELLGTILDKSKDVHAKGEAYGKTNLTYMGLIRYLSQHISDFKKK